MNKNNRSLLIAGILGLILIAAAIWVASTQLEWVPTKHRTGFAKEARENPYLAGQLLLNRLGYDTQRREQRGGLETLPVRSTLLLPSFEAYDNPQLRTQLLDWVKRGGHLVLELDQAQTHDKLLNDLGVTLEGRAVNHDEDFLLTVEDAPVTVQLPSPTVFTLDDDPEWSADLRGHFKGKPPGFKNDDGDGDDEDAVPSRIFIPSEGQTHKRPKQAGAQGDQNPNDSRARAIRISTQTPDDSDKDEEDNDSDTVALYARFAYGKGQVTVGNFHPFKNNTIDTADHAPLFVRLMTLPDGPRPVVIQYTPEYPGLLEWLGEHASEAWLALAVLIIAGLWRAVPRFGPLLPEPPPVRPGLREHLAACGHFLLQRHAYEPLIAPLREEVLRQLEQLQHRHPDIDSNEKLAAHLSGIKVEEVARALTPGPDSHNEFLRRSHTLAALRAHCNRLRHPSSVPGVPK